MDELKGAVSSKGESAINRLTGDANIYDMVSVGQSMKVSPEIEEQIHRTMEALFPSVDQPAKFLLDIYFNEERSLHHPFSGFLMAWTNGGFAHGGGDEKVYFCPQVVEGKDGMKKRCAAPMPPNLIQHKFGVCLSCKRPSPDKNFVGEVYFKLPIESWAPVIQRYFFRLECNADIRLGIMRGDLRAATEEEQVRDLRGEKLEKVRRDREWVRYALKDLIRDGASGATLESRINAFLRA